MHPPPDGYGSRQLAGERRFVAAEWGTDGQPSTEMKMTIALLLFVLLALILGIGGAVEVSLWFLLFLVIAAVAVVALVKRSIRR